MNPLPSIASSRDDASRTLCRDWFALPLVLLRYHMLVVLLVTPIRDHSPKPMSFELSKKCQQASDNQSSNDLLSRIKVTWNDWKWLIAISTLTLVEQLHVGRGQMSPGMNLSTTSCLLSIIATASCFTSPIWGIDPWPMSFASLGCPFRTHPPRHDSIPQWSRSRSRP